MFDVDRKVIGDCARILIESFDCAKNTLLCFLYCNYENFLFEIVI